MAHSQSARHRKQQASKQTPESKAISQQIKKKHEKASLTSRCCSALYKVFIASVLISVAFSIVLAFKTSPIESEELILPPPRPLTGALAANTKLQQAEKLLEGKVIGPEAFAYHNGRIYTGTYTGQVIEISNDKDIKVIAELGTPPCGTRDDEKNCGRPLGIRIIDDKLYVIDAYLGLYEIDMAQKKPPVQIFSTNRPIGGHTMKFANDFRKLESGEFLFTDSSYKLHVRDFGLLAIANQGCGRLLWYNPANDTASVALDNLHFPNGITLSPKQDFLLVAETGQYRILKYHLKGPKAGTSEVFIDNLPGAPDNITPSRNGGYWVGLALAIARVGPVNTDFVGRLPWLRNQIAKVIDPTSLIPHFPDYGLIIELNQKGEIVQSLHDPTGKVAGSVSEILDTGDALYLGSIFAPYILKLDL